MADEKNVRNKMEQEVKTRLKRELRVTLGREPSDAELDDVIMEEGKRALYKNFLDEHERV